MSLLVLVEHARECLGRDAAARVPHRERQAIRRPSATTSSMPPTSVNFIALASRFSRIWRTRSGVDQHVGRDARRDVARQRHAVVARQALDRGEDVTHELPHRHRLRVDAGTAHGNRRIVQQVVDQLQQVRAVARDDAGVLASLVRVAPVDDQASEAEDGGDRRAQFMRDVVEELRLELGRALGCQTLGFEPTAFAT